MEMPECESASRQASSVVTALSKNTGKSIRDSSRQALYQIAKSDFIRTQQISLRGITVAQANAYLNHRAKEVVQKTLNQERLALQAMLRHVTGQLGPNHRLAFVISKKHQAVISRAYTKDQIKMIVEAQRERSGLATDIAYAAGLRPPELLTLKPISERPPDERPALETKFSGREGASYTVIGKEGLTREVVIPVALRDRLEARRLSESSRVKDRGIDYTQHYAIAGGKVWSGNFSAASQRALGWSSGASGLQHSYAQERMIELQVRKYLTREVALETVSQEMGHFETDIIEVYSLTPSI